MIKKTERKNSPDSDRGKFLYISDDRVASEYAPYFYVEARIEFNDVRTRYHGTMTMNKAMEIHPESAALLWADDMVVDVDAGKIKLAIPGFDPSDRLPGFVNNEYISGMENRFVQFVLRSLEAGIFRNADLNVYSHSGESRNEFVARCIELFDIPKRNELDKMYHLYRRRLEQVREKYLSPGDTDGSERALKDSEDRKLFSKYSDRIAMFFLKGDDACDPVPLPSSSRMTELEERLSDLELEARHAAAEIRDAYLEKAQALDEYLVHPNLKDIHIVRSFILWMPHEAV
jgi:hypothetical protein